MMKMTDTYRDATGLLLLRPVLITAATSTRRCASDGGTALVC